MKRHDSWPARRALNRLGREIGIAHKVTKSNATIGTLPFSLITFSQISASEGSIGTFIYIGVSGYTYTFLTIYSFDLSNQLSGIKEDRINKADRPLVTGILSPIGAALRLIASSAAFVTISIGFDVFWWAIAWICIFTLNNHLGLAKHPFTKPMIVGIQGFIQMMSAWQFSGGGWEIFWWALPVSFLLAALMPLQDLRDVVGDCAVGRITLPILFGDKKVRRYLTYAFCVTPFAMHYTAFRAINPGLFAELTLSSICAITVVRLIQFKGIDEDDLTYRTLVLWYCCATSTPLIHFAS
ncbi:UbiA family prenyltransferase [Streptomyces sp. TX20-6-3]|uniref:UbiA family prenyltransferase n=1 Tax=Streptomyces sp. TX20-6-3 TaxID=3028705 RepID=UPI0029A5F289|nr:UbiA family prenyltransferase [Streptomyces sp. TX20-6-3]MDX2565402.1 UbiA family prenyltransferase [Streptomyces sp. TX20-6-3]